MEQVSKRRVWPGLAVPAALIVGVVALVGCAGPATTGDPGGGDSAEEPVEPTGPNPLIGLECESLVDPSALDEAFGTVELKPDPVLVPGGSWPLSHVGLANLGALDCYWGYGEASAVDGEKSYLSVSVRPNAAEVWTTWESATGMVTQPVSGFGDAAYTRCGDDPDHLFCHYDVLVGSNWLTVRSGGVTSTDAVDSIMHGVIDAVAAAEQVEQAWASTPAPVPTSCADLVSDSEVAAAVATPGVAARDIPLLMPASLNDALPGGLSCSWSNSYSSEQAMPVQLVVLPNAGWAWDTAWAKPRQDRTPAEPLAGVGDQAFAGCATDQNVCFVDVLIGDTWITADSNKQAGIDGLTQLAEAAVAKLST